MPTGEPAPDPIEGRPLRQCAISAFNSQSVTANLLRGAAAFALLYAAVSLRLEHPGWALVAVGLSFVAMRGGPVCWTTGLVEAIVRRWRAMKAGRQHGPRVTSKRTLLHTTDGGTNQDTESSEEISVPRTP
jgi:hypothetical protein